jgi:hypothetical protein
VWTDENIFRPLGMNASHFRDNLGEVFPNRAWSYLRAPDSTWRLAANGLLAQGSSSLFASADDLAKWLMNFSTPTVGGNSAIDRMLQRTKLNDSSEVKYAFGVLVDDWRGLRMITHSGGWAGYSTFTVWFPEIRGGVVMLANTPANPGALGFALSEIFFAKHLKPNASVTVAGSSPPNIATSLMDEYAGLYKLGPAWYVRIRREGNELRTQATQEQEFPMVPLSQTEFNVPAYSASITFVRDSAGKVSSVMYRGRKSPRVTEAERPLKLADYEGDYTSDELSITYKAFVRDGILMLGNFRRGSFRLTRAFGDDFRSQTWTITFDRDASGRVVGFVANAGERNRNVRFAKK